MSKPPSETAEIDALVDTMTDTAFDAGYLACLGRRGKAPLTREDMLAEIAKARAKWRRRNAMPAKVSA